MVSHRVEIADGEILQLLLDGANAEPMRDGSVNFERFQRRIAPLLLRLEIQCPHIVQPVRQLDDDHTDILRHRQQHLADILRLLFLLGGKRHLAELCHAIHKVGDGLAEFRGDILKGFVRILHHIMQERGDYRFLIHPHLREDTRHADRVDDIGLAGIAVLPLVRLARERIGSIHLGDLLGRKAFGEQLAQSDVAVALLWGGRALRLLHRGIIADYWQAVVQGSLRPLFFVRHVDRLQSPAGVVKSKNHRDLPLLCPVGG